MKVFRDKFKNQAIKTLIKSFNESLEYEPKNSIPQEIYEKAEFSTFETYWSEDLISGKVLNDCKVNMAEVHTGVSTNKEFITIFNGMFAVIDTPKTFNKAIHIRENNRNVKFSDLKIELDFTDFENLFDIYSSDEITTMQILTADNMQKLVEFYKKTSIPYEFTIKDNHIYIALPFGRLFEPSKRLLIISPKSFSKSDMKLFAIDREELYRNYLILNYTFELIEILVKIVNDTPYE